MSLSLINKHLNELLTARKIVERVVHPSEPTYPVPTRSPFSSGVGNVYMNEKFREESKVHFDSFISWIYLISVFRRYII